MYNVILGAAGEFHKDDPHRYEGYYLDEDYKNGERMYVKYDRKGNVVDTIEDDFDSDVSGSLYHVQVYNLGFVFS